MIKLKPGWRKCNPVLQVKANQIMKLKFNKNFLDFKEGHQYEVTPESTAKYIVAMRIAKTVVQKNGKTAEEIKAEEEAKALEAEAAERARVDAENEAKAEADAKAAAEKAEVKTAPKNKTEAAAKPADVKPAPKNKTEAAAKKIIPGSDAPDDLLGFDN